MTKFYIKSFIISIFLPAFFFTNGCTIIDPKEKVPTYIHVDSFQFTGIGSHDIQYAWVYYNHSAIGAFDLPFTIPVITSGTGLIEIAPGIAINGRNERPISYPFYTIDTFTLRENPGQIVYHTPKTRYFDSISVTLISDFEGGTTKFSKWSGTTSIITVNADSLVFDGSGSGAVYLNSPNDSSIDSNTIAFTINTTAAFIEFDYYSSIQFSLGMQASLNNTYNGNLTFLAGVLPNNKWQKFYLNVTKFISDYPGGTYHLFLKTSLPNGQTNGRLLIDNIKLVTFK